MQESDLIGLAIEVSGSGTEDFAERSSNGPRQKSLLLRNAASIRALVFRRAVSASGWTESHPEAQQRIHESPSERLRFNRLQLASFPAYPADQCEPKVPAAHRISVRDEVKS